MRDSHDYSIEDSREEKAIGNMCLTVPRFLDAARLLMTFLLAALGTARTDAAEDGGLSSAGHCGPDDRPGHGLLGITLRQAWKQLR